MKDDALNRIKVLRGEDLPFSKLTADDVRMIRSLDAHRRELRRQASELTTRKLAEKFDVHWRTIEKIISGECWGHVV